MIWRLTDADRDTLLDSGLVGLGSGAKAVRIIDQQAEALAAAEARIAAATEILLGSGGHLASEVLAALRGQR